MRADGAKLAQWSTLLAGITASGENPTSQRALEAMCAEMLASLSSPQEPVAWQWRYRDWAGSRDGTNKWSEWLPGRMPETRPVHEDREERALVVASPVEPVVAAKAEAEGCREALKRAVAQLEAHGFDGEASGANAALKSLEARDKSAI